MDTVTLDPPAAVIAERQRLGLDGRDEVWDGEYHMVPPASNEHQRVEMLLAFALMPVVDAVGLVIRPEIGLFDPDAPGDRDFRAPDLTIYHPEIGSERGADGAASLVVEIRSPGDESFQKLPYFERLGVGEVLIVDRDTKAVRRWVNGDDGLIESEGDPVGHHRLACVPATLHTDEGELVVTTEHDTNRI